MTKNRLEAFSDGVIAIIITIMVLTFEIPKGTGFSALLPLVPKFISYILSFIYVGIYWNNHHHMFQTIQKINGKIMWANLTLLFLLSLTPFTTAWMGENDFAKNPVALYGINLMLCAVAYTILEKTAIKSEGKSSKLATAVGKRIKENLSTIIYLTGIVISFFFPKISVVCYFAVALIWIIPDKRIEKQSI